MVAYNFDKQFVPAIESGEKKHTIRRIGARRHARPGEKLQLYTGQRTKACRKIIDDPTCLAVETIVIRIGAEGVSVCIAGEWVGDLDAFARSDGFADADHFHTYWTRNFGYGDHEHKLIKWG